MMNPFLNISHAPTSAITVEFVKSYHIFILTDCYNQGAIEGWDISCRKNKVGFILANCVGMLGNLFVDFGQGFKVLDKLHSAKKTHQFIKNISKQRPGLVTLQNLGRPFALETGDFVTIKEVEGMVEVNGNEPRPIKMVDPTSFSIETTLCYNSYTRGGLVVTEPVPLTLNFESFKDHASKPRFRPSNNGAHNQIELHIGMMIYFELREELEADVCYAADSLGEAEIQKFVSDVIITRDYIKSMISQFTCDVGKLKKLVLKLVQSKKGQFLPVCHLIANFASVQVIAFTGKFPPVNQTLYFDVSHFYTEDLHDSLSFADINPLDHHFETYRDINERTIDHTNLRYHSLIQDRYHRVWCQGNRSRPPARNDEHRDRFKGKVHSSRWTNCET